MGWSDMVLLDLTMEGRLLEVQGEIFETFEVILSKSNQNRIEGV